MEPAVKQWIRRYVDDEMVPLISLHLRLDAATRDELIDGWVTPGAVDLLDVVDLALTMTDPPPGPRSPSGLHPAPAWVALERILVAGSSVWRVASDHRSLERRLEPTVTKAAAEAAPSHTDSARHLAEAWRAVYGRRPDSSKAYSESIKAVEAAAIPVVVPNQAAATLGHVLGQLRANATGWELAILGPGPTRATSDAGALVAMLELLLIGHCDRHAPTTPVPPDAAPMALHLAATLVQWFASGAVRKRP